MDDATRAAANEILKDGREVMRPTFDAWKEAVWEITDEAIAGFATVEAETTPKSAFAAGFMGGYEVGLHTAICQGGSPYVYIMAVIIDQLMQDGKTAAHEIAEGLIEVIREANGKNIEQWAELLRVISTFEGTIAPTKERSDA